jgi:phenylacetate-CoA ligase
VTICKKIDEFNPEIIKTYPSFAYTLSQYLQKHKTISIKPKAIITGSEKLYPEQKDFMQKIFGCEVYDFYAMWELLMFANSCSHGNLHTTPELGILETIQNGKRCKKGETGELVCTTLHNYSMPLLRYATGDYGYIEDMECPCGRKSEILNIVGSRNKDLIITKNGFINVMSGTPWFGHKSRIKQIQFYQDKKGAATVRLVPDDNFNVTDLNKLKESLHDYFSDSVDLNFEFVDEIPRTATGKYKYVESKVPIEW